MDSGMNPDAVGAVSSESSEPYRRLLMLPLSLLAALGMLTTGIWKAYKNGVLRTHQGAPQYSAMGSSWAMATTVGRRPSADVEDVAAAAEAPAETGAKCPVPHHLIPGFQEKDAKAPVHSGPYAHMPGPRPLPLDFIDNTMDVTWILRFGFPEAIVRWEKKYGPIFRFAAMKGIPGWTFAVDPECVQYISGTNSKNYMGRFLPAVYEMVYEGKGILGSEGEYNKKHRSLCQAPFLSTKLLRIFSIGMVKSTKKLNQIWAKHGGVDADISIAMQRLTLDIVGEIAFSYDFKELERTDLELQGKARLDEDRLLDTINGTGDLMGKIFITPLPILRVLQKIKEPGVTSLEAQLKEMREIVTPVIQERRNALERGEPAPNDLLGVLLTEDSPALTADELWDDVHDVMGAGHETTGSTLTAALYSIAEHPRVYDKLKAELREVLGDRDMTFEDIEEGRLPYLEMVVKEVLRLYPAIPLFPRIAAEDDVLPTGHFVPAGDVVFQSGYAMGRSARLFPEPMEFKPERFTPDEEAARHPRTWAPFGAGPRMCLGAKFAMLSLQMMLGTLLQHNDFKNLKSRGKIFPIEYDITMNFPGGVPMRVAPHASA